MKKILSVILLLAMCMPLLVACKDEPIDEVTLAVVANGECHILYDPATTTSDMLEGLKTAIEEKTGAKVTMTSAWSFTGFIRVEEGNLIVGNVEVDACQRVTAPLREQDYFVGISGAAFVIGGRSVAATEEAVEYFKKNLLRAPDENGVLTYRESESYAKAGNYSIGSVSIGGVPLWEFTIVVPDKNIPSEWRTAVLLKEMLLKRTGYSLEIVHASKASAEGGQIRIGTSLARNASFDQDHTYHIKAAEGLLELYAESLYGYEKMYDMLNERVFRGSQDSIVLTAENDRTGRGSGLSSEPLLNSGDLRVMFNNVYGGSEGDVAQRVGMLVELYYEYLPDVLGLQEYSPAVRVAGMSEMLAPLYTEIVVPGYEGSENQRRTPLFYRADKLDVLECGYLQFDTLSYTEYPDLLYGYTPAEIKQKARDSSKGVNWAIFRVKATGEVFMVGSTHLWWQNNVFQDDVGRCVQMAAARDELGAAAAAFAAEHGIAAGTIPILYGGDYNSRGANGYVSLATMNQGAYPFYNLNDAAPSGAKLTMRTNHGYSTYSEERGIWVDPQSINGNYEIMAIDHIYGNMAARNCYQVLAMGMLTEEYSFLGSDHCPIFCDLSFGASMPRLAQ